MIEAKTRLRADAKARRALLSAQIRSDAAARLAVDMPTFLSGLVAGPCTISGFLAIGEEINPAPLLSRLHGEGWRIALPVMVGKGKALTFRTWTPGAPLRTVMWGIREPLESSPEVLPDVVLAPLLAFDGRGFRLGYGGGFYDRTLKALRAAKPVVAVGLAYGMQKVDAVPHLDYDERLDWVFTPEGPIPCRT